jgi:N-acyl-D-amino-acid deacylase
MVVKAHQVRKMTSLPAQRLGFPDRGLLRPRAAADVVCFAPKQVRDITTYEVARSYPVGMPHVLLNGVAVKWEDRHTGSTPGQALRRRGSGVTGLPHPSVAVAVERRPRTQVPAR